MKELMGTLSPAYGMIKGEGLFGNAVGLLPAIAKDARGDRQKKKDEEAAKASSAQAMKKGGMVKSSASKRADGVAVKGKTRGKMV
jgi:hypothetical protein